MPYKIDSDLPAKVAAEAAKFGNLFVFRGEGKGPNSPTSRRGLTVFSVPVGKPVPVGAVIETAYRERGLKDALTAKSDIRYAQGGERGGGVIIALLRRRPDTGDLVIANLDGIPVPNASLLEAAGRNPANREENFFEYGDVFLPGDGEAAAAVSAEYFPPVEAEAEAKAATPTAAKAETRAEAKARKKAEAKAAKAASPTA